MASVMSPDVMNAKKSGRQNVEDLQGKVSEEALDLAKRLTSCHQNALEGLPLFAAGVAFAVAAKTPLDEISNYCGVYIGARVMFLIFYALPPIASGIPRTIAWFVSTIASISLWTSSAKYLS